MSLARVFVRSSLVRRSTARVVRGGGGGRMIPFARLAPPTEKLVDDVDLVWDDGVAPEPAIDVELHENVPLSQVLTLQLTFALLILGTWGVATWLDPADSKPIAPRRLALPTREEMEFDDDHGRAQLD
eukprot:CAMPEP_0114428278 /NCGR_PEP_ID=MMETSP0103-20121206/8837_1 /TAXON_ID=37642 ORGANISM="Paraphysomonas imperforata, Strain PA2" /NCGR_SAMPLE_ID=MMETSP0103 /ASSEMBLY_ACC=CAM_ASM_000201 /LENGTH=127 /DNA_ID=CAMNT_0001597477 /DNA_START=28 /DNA_END=411 /DNA_ORIENTATION=-